MGIDEKKSRLFNKKQLSLKQNFSWTIIGNIISAGCKWVILVIIAKFGTPQMLGIYTLGYAITAPIFMLTNLQLRAIQSTDVKNEYSFSHYFKLRMITNVIGLLVVVFLMFVLDYDTETVYVVIFVAIIKYVDSISDIFYGQMQKHERMDFISKSMIIREVFALFLFSIVLIYLNNLIYSLIAFTLVYLIIVLTYDMIVSFNLQKCIKKISFIDYILFLLTNWDKLKLKKLLILSLPLGIGVFLGSLVTNIPRYLVDYFLGKESLGYFAAIAYFVIGFSTFFKAVGQAARPRLSKYFFNNFEQYIKLVYKLILVNLCFSLMFFVISIVAGKEILTILYSPSYGRYWKTLIWISVALIFQSVSNLLQIAIQSAQVYNVQIFISLFTIMISVIVGILLIPIKAVEGAGLTILIYSIVNTVVVAFIFFKIARAQILKEQN